MGFLIILINVFELIGLTLLAGLYGYSLIQLVFILIPKGIDKYINI